MATKYDIHFCQRLLYPIVQDVRRHDPKIKLRDAWVHKADKSHWEFHYGEFYWHGSASNAYEARAKGWSSWLRKAGVVGYAD